MRFVVHGFVYEQIIGQHDGQKRLLFELLVGLPELLGDWKQGQIGGEARGSQQLSVLDLELFANDLQELGKRGFIFEHNCELLLRQPGYFEFVVFDLQEAMLQPQQRFQHTL